MPLKKKIVIKTNAEFEDSPRSPVSAVQDSQNAVVRAVPLSNLSTAANHKNLI